MKKLFALLLVLTMALGCVSFASAAEIDPELIKAAQEEGELVVYGSCEEPYVAAAAKHFEELYGIKTYYQRLSTGEVQAKITEEAGNPSGDVWFGGTTDPYNESAKAGLLMAYEAKNAADLASSMYRDADGYWYGIYKGILGFMVNTEELQRLGLEAPKGWDDLIKPEYKGLVWMSNPNTAGTAKLVINTMVQMKGHDEAMKYFVELDKNIAQYTKSGSGPSKKVGIGECVIGIGFLHDGIKQILDGYDNIARSSPARVPALRSAPPPFSRAARIPTPPSCGLSTPCLPSAWSWPMTPRAISSWSSTALSSPRLWSPSAWIPTT